MTIWNLTTNSEGLPVVGKPAILQGIYWSSSYEAKISGDRTLVIIPMSLKIDGRAYIEAAEYALIPDEERNNYWTLAKGDRIINRATEMEFSRIGDIEKAFGFDKILTVNSISVNNFGSEQLQTFVISGR